MVKNNMVKQSIPQQIIEVIQIYFYTLYIFQCLTLTLTTRWAKFSRI